MSAAIAATANATEASQQAKERWSPSVARARTTPSIAPASGWRSSTRLPISGRALVSTKAPRADTSRRAAGGGVPATRTHIRRLLQRVAIAVSRPILPATAMRLPLFVRGQATTVSAKKGLRRDREAGGPAGPRRGAGLVGGGAAAERPRLEAGDRARRHED